MKKKKKSKRNKILAALLDIPWLGIVLDILVFLKEKIEKINHAGMYEVLEYEITLELHDSEGRHATVNKREKVRFLQDNIIAYQDQAWGDGEILQDYRCSPGLRADQYRSGYKTLVLISLREVKNRGDIEEFKFKWGIENGFLRDTEQWETQVNHRTQSLQIKVVFPKERPPLRCLGIEQIRHKSKELWEENRLQLPDGRWEISLKVDQPRKGENYILQWVW